MSYPCFSKKRQAILSPRRPSNKCSATMIIMFPEPGLYFKQSRDCFEVFVVQEEQLLPPKRQRRKESQSFGCGRAAPWKNPSRFFARVFAVDFRRRGGSRQEWRERRPPVLGL